MSEMAPRGIYASGKSSSAAGLCVSPESLIEVDGKTQPIGDFIESRMRSPMEIEPGVEAGDPGERVTTVSADRHMDVRTGGSALPSANPFISCGTFHRRW